MNKTKMIKTVKKETKYNPANGDASGQYHSGNSLHASGRVRRRTILGEKFDYGEKIKEKQNYVLYQAGQGQEKKEIEEIEELSNQVNKKEKIIEKKEIIDNYQYHETKDIKKNMLGIRRQPTKDYVILLNEQLSKNIHRILQSQKKEDIK